jgi:hypothetical protein
MTAMQQVWAFVNYVTEPGEKEPEVLARLCDELARAMHDVTYTFDDRDYPDPPDSDYAALYKRIGGHFPDFGYYNLPALVTTGIGEPREPRVGCAIDDLTDITIDLTEALWYLEHTSADNGARQLEFTYQSHWRRHLRDLQFYLEYRSE